MNTYMPYDMDEYRITIHAPARNIESMLKAFAGIGVTDVRVEDAGLMGAVITKEQSPAVYHAAQANRATLDIDMEYGLRALREAVIAYGSATGLLCDITHYPYGEELQLVMSPSGGGWTMCSYVSCSYYARAQVIYEIRPMMGCSSRPYDSREALIDKIDRILEGKKAGEWFISHAILRS